MQLLTYADLKTKISNDYDIADENFVSDEELLAYANEAIDDAETAIHTMHHEDKYFLVTDTISLVNGTSQYDMPSDIYANKIRMLFYDDGSANRYKLERVVKLEETPFFQTGDLYKYLIVNPSSTTGPQLKFYPTPNITNATYMKIWYIRNMERMTDEASVCEIPECVNFVYQHMRRSVAKKTRRQDLIATESADLQIQYSLMLDALKDMTADENNLARMDLSAYFDQETGFIY